MLELRELYAVQDSSFAVFAVAVTLYSSALTTPLLDMYLMFSHVLLTGNIIMVVAIIFCGATYQKLSLIAKFLRLCFFSKTLFYELQRRLVLPVIQSAWRAEQLRVRMLLSGKVHLCD